MPKKDTDACQINCQPGRRECVNGSLPTRASYQLFIGVWDKGGCSLARPKKEAIPIAQKAVKDGYNVIIAMGGDGTIGR